jgi:hypothetical protein
MADSERVQHLQEVRKEMCEKRVWLIGRLIERDTKNNEEIHAVVESALLNTQQVIDVIDKAIEHEAKSGGSRYSIRGLAGS